MPSPKNSNQNQINQRKANELYDALLKSDWPSIGSIVKAKGTGPLKLPDLLPLALQQLPLSYLRRLAPVFNEFDNPPSSDLEAAGHFWIQNECPAEAEQCYRLSLAQEPSRLLSLLSLSNLLNITGRLDSSRTLLETARELYPTNPDILAALGNVYLEHHQIEEGLAAYQLAEEQQTANAWQHGLAFVRGLAYLPDVTADDLKEAGQDWELRYAPPAPHPPLPTASDRVRVGYYSPDLRNHSISYFFRSILNYHDHSQFEIYLYSDTHFTDSITQELRERAHHWRDLTNKSDSEVVSLIKSDQLHLLIDLSGHFGNARPQIFAPRPAPIQAHLLGYNGTTGLTSLDYRFSDPISDPPQYDNQSSEKVIRLEPGFHCFQQEPGITIDEGPPPSQILDHVTFGSFNTAPKLNDLVIETWCQILQALPSSRLLLKTVSLSEQAGKDRILARFTSRGIAEERLDLLPPARSKTDHLKLYRRIDIALDPFPVNGTTTTCEAFWMGVPVLSLLGNRHSARVTSSLLSQIGLESGICQSRQEYVERAIAWANDPDQLRLWRQNLRQSLSHGPLGNAESFTQRLENSYLRMVKEHPD